MFLVRAISPCSPENCPPDSSRKEEVPPFNSVGSSLCSRLLSRPAYNHHNAFNVKRRSDTVGVAWPVDLWEMAEVRKRAGGGGEGGGSADSLCRDLIHAPVARIKH